MNILHEFHDVFQETGYLPITMMFLGVALFFAGLWYPEFQAWLSHKAEQRKQARNKRGEA